MFTAENEEILIAFQALCEQYPRENVVALWEMAGGTTTLAVDERNESEKVDPSVAFGG